MGDGRQTSTTSNPELRQAANKQTSDKGQAITYPAQRGFRSIERRDGQRKQREEREKEKEREIQREYDPWSKFELFNCGSFKRISAKKRRLGDSKRGRKEENRKKKNSLKEAFLSANRK